MIWFVIFLFGLIIGIAFCLLVQFVLLKQWYFTLPLVKPPIRLQNNNFQLPKEIIDAIFDPELKSKKETCIGLNLLFQFLFRELRDTTKMRRWVMKRMDIEFLELLNTTAGKLLYQIVVRDIRLGDTLPVIKEVSVADVRLKDESYIEELSLLVDIVYNGGFQLAVDVDMMFGKSAYVSVKVTKLVGKARLQLSRLPYTHWSLAFIEEPVLEFEAESQLDGRPIQQLTNLIINQIRRSVRKKHTLPYYKFRYKPFFTKPEPELPVADVECHGRRLSVGKLCVTVVQCSRLFPQPAESTLYVTLALDKMPWTELITSRRNMWIAYDCSVVKHQFETIGLTMKDEFVLDRFEEMVVVDSVVPRSSADLANIKKGDLVISVNGLKVSDTRMAVRVMKQAPDKFKVRIERSSLLLKPSAIPPPSLPRHPSLSSRPNSLPQQRSETSQQTADNIANGFQYEEDNLNIKFDRVDPDGEEFVNISFRPVDAVRESELNHSGSESDGSSDTRGPRLRRKINSDSVSMPGDKTSATSEPPSSPPPPWKPVHSDPALRRNRSTDSDETQSVISEGELDLRRTSSVSASRDPEFDESFHFDVEDKHRYLNLCLWCRQPKKFDKQNRLVSPEKDVLIGHTSVPLMNVALECLSTLQGDLLTSYHLSPFQARNATKAKMYPVLATHKGYDDNLCHGDVILRFQHSTKSLSTAERRRLLLIKRHNEEVEEEKLRQAGERRPEDAIKNLSTKSKSLPEGHHRFSSIRFTGATFCDFCHKKIWFKNGYRCEVCGLSCHKKCSERCQTNTICTESGFRFKDSQALVESAVKAAKELKGVDTSAAATTAAVSKATAASAATAPAAATTAKVSAGSATSKAAAMRQKGAEILQNRSSLFSRLRRSDRTVSDKTMGGSDKPELTSLSLHEPRPARVQDGASDAEGAVTGSGYLQSTARKRRNSLTDLTPTNTDDTDPFADDLGEGAPLQKTRSSSSLNEIKGKEADTTSEPNSLDARDTPILRYYEQQQYTARADEQVVTRAKEMGKELFNYLPPTERREKLDAMINKLQTEIDEESENRAELVKEDKATKERRLKAQIHYQIEKSDDRIQSLAVLMLHYCAGLQHCMEELELAKSRPDNTTASSTTTLGTGEPQRSGEDPDSDVDAFHDSHSSHAVSNLEQDLSDSDPLQYSPGSPFTAHSSRYDPPNLSARAGASSKQHPFVSDLLLECHDANLSSDQSSQMGGDSDIEEGEEVKGAERSSESEEEQCMIEQLRHEIEGRGGSSHHHTRRLAGESSTVTFVEDLDEPGISLKDQSGISLRDKPGLSLESKVTKHSNESISKGNSLGQEKSDLNDSEIYQDFSENSTESY